MRKENENIKCKNLALSKLPISKEIKLEKEKALSRAAKFAELLDEHQRKEFDIVLDELNTCLASEVEEVYEFAFSQGFRKGTKENIQEK